MTEIKRRVGQAILDALPPEVAERIGDETLDDLTNAAIAAMREPTQAMAYAALRDYDLGSIGITRYIFTNTDPGLAPAIYRGMIDEALK